MPSFQFELVSPERLLFAGEVDSVVVPASEGQITVLKDHAPFMSTMKPGVVEVSDGARTQRLFVRGGFADVSAKGLTILAEQAVPVEELDLAAINAEIKNAEEDFNDARTDDARRAASERLSQLREVKVALGL
jgi:F-type H+-transporting ATPase subunit epsilon